MSAPLKVTPQAMAEFQEEAIRRAQGRTNKLLAIRAGLSPKYVGQIVARLRREYESKCLRVDVPRGSTSNVNT